MNFIKKIFLGKTDESVHRQFTRFGKGEYGGRAVLNLWKTSENAKIKSSFEFANDLAIFAAGLGNLAFSGSIWSKDEIQGLHGEKKTGKWVYEVENMGSNQIKEIASLVSYFLLNADSVGIKLKIKGKLPKPGKDESKIDDKFCQLEIDGKYYQQAREDFFWDLPECKKASVEHRFVINEIVLPKTNEKDYAKLREMAKRKGKIIRIVNADGREIKTEKDFEA